MARLGGRGPLSKHILNFKFESPPGQHSIGVGEPAERPSVEVCKKRATFTAKTYAFVLVVAFVLSVSCITSAVVLAMSIHEVASVLEVAEKSVDPVFRAMVPTLTHAEAVMETAARSTGAIEAFLNRTVEAADESIPAIKNAASALNSSSILISRMARLAAHPTIRVDVVPAGD